jgi:hypothetical protein
MPSQSPSKKLLSTTKKVTNQTGALYGESVGFCEEEGWTFAITADQADPLMKQIEALEEEERPEYPSLSSERKAGQRLPVLIAPRSSFACAVPSLSPCRAPHV